jgi:hypothetical protein
MESPAVACLALCTVRYAFEIVVALVCACAAIKWHACRCVVAFVFAVVFFVAGLLGSGAHATDATLSQRLSPQSVWAGLCKSIRVSAAILVGAKLSLAFLSAYLQSSVLPAGVSSCVAWVSCLLGLCRLLQDAVVAILSVFRTVVGHGECNVCSDHQFHRNRPSIFCHSFRIFLADSSCHVPALCVYPHRAFHSCTPLALVCFFGGATVCGVATLQHHCF